MPQVEGQGCKANNGAPSTDQTSVITPTFCANSCGFWGTFRHNSNDHEDKSFTCAYLLRGRERIARIG